MNFIKNKTNTNTKAVEYLIAQTKELENIYLSGNLGQDIKFFKNIFKKDVTLRFKRIRVHRKEHIECVLMYIDGMVDSMLLNEGVIEPLITVSVENNSESLAEYIEKQILFARDVKVKKNVAEILQGIMYGEAALLIDESAEAVLVDAKGFKTRGISEPQDERILQGPREGFEEAGLLNLAMIRRKLQTPDLCFEMLRVGRRSDTMVYICYLNSLADEKQITALKKPAKIPTFLPYFPLKAHKPVANASPLIYPCVESVHGISIPKTEQIAHTTTKSNTYPKAMGPTVRGC